ncbi:twin-arginine translocation signal domain-containing protein [Flavivirga amylovorans]|uniref:Twin-arginine translocation signal domain-containing protein n=1 Tax=Flavivirga amylovorans TaxID=870486 RepID=A0ABT8WWZ7_9FLAO|nr:twin-arginine translocation signal domain-containing protein [Flavivirga amylovorans]MDO5986188.1 twin-arginine translocation signal domain-containing protein [Flavivirga amylovorans]
MKNSRRDFIKTTALASAAITIPTYGFSIINKPSLSKQIIGHGDFKYRVHQQWGNLNPENTPVKNCHEMVMDSKGRLIMVTDEVKNNIIVYDKSGKLLSSWTHNMKSAHGLTLFKEGEDDVLFITEPLTGKIIKTTIDGKVIMELPNPKEIGVYDKDNPRERYKPTETAIAPNGDIYVADGYGSDWVLQFNSNGEFIRKFGGKGFNDDQLSNAHGVAIDDRDPNNITLLCTSRKHNAFKRFTLDGKYLETIYLPGAFVCRPVIDGENLYSGVCWSRLKYLEQTPDSGFVTILDKKNKVVSNPGGTAPKYKKGKLKMMVQDTPLFNHCHDVCVDEDKNLYVCQWNANKSYPIKLERV